MTLVHFAAAALRQRDDFQKKNINHPGLHARVDKITNPDGGTFKNDPKKKAAGMIPAAQRC
jgi:hypothetical protein